MKENSLLVEASRMYRQGLLSEAATLYKEILQENPEQTDAIVNLANILVSAGNVTAGINLYKKALKIESNNPIALNNLGNAFKLAGKIELAALSYKEALIQKPNYANALNNLSLLELKRNNLQAASKFIEQALKLEANRSEFLNTYGAILEEKGQSNEALLTFKLAVKNAPEHIESYINLTKSRLQFFNQRKRELEKIDLSRFPDCQNKFILGVQVALESYLVGKIDNAERVLKKLKILPGTDSNKQSSYATAYFKLLNNLCPRIKNQKTDVTDKIFHIGDSHCLSFAHQTVSVNDQKYKIVPILTIGAKSYHFTTTKTNKYKSITLKNIEDLPLGSKLFISFGEIDCRIDEGYLVAAKKNNINLDDLIKSTVDAYICWFTTQVLNFGHKIAFLNVPAPIYRRKLSKTKNLSVLEVIRLHNKYIDLKAKELGYNVIDVYSITTGPDGFSNLRHHIDTQHLGPTAIHAIPISF
jgi:tetratricopeptide (TPR) repeat protein